MVATPAVPPDASARPLPYPTTLAGPLGPPQTGLQPSQQPLLPAPVLLTPAGAATTGTPGQAGATPATTTIVPEAPEPPQPPPPPPPAGMSPISAPIVGPPVAGTATTAPPPGGHGGAPALLLAPPTPTSAPAPAPPILCQVPPAPTPSPVFVRAHARPPRFTLLFALHTSSFDALSTCSPQPRWLVVRTTTLGALSSPFLWTQGAALLPKALQLSKTAQSRQAARTQNRQITCGNALSIVLDFVRVLPTSLRSPAGAHPPRDGTDLWCGGVGWGLRWCGNWDGAHARAAAAGLDAGGVQPADLRRASSTRPFLRHQVVPRGRCPQGNEGTVPPSPQLPPAHPFRHLFRFSSTQESLYHTVTRVIAPRARLLWPLPLKPERGAHVMGCLLLCAALCSAHLVTHPQPTHHRSKEGPEGTTWKRIPQ